MEDYRSLVLSTVADGVAHVVLNRPERQNAWNGPLGRRYFQILFDLARDTEVRVIVVSGAGGSFCTGGDTEVLTEIAAQGSHEPAAENPPYWSALSVAKPIIGAIAGPCFGLGLQQALCFDVRFAAEDAKFSTAYVRRGLSSELGMSWLLPRIVGAGRAADLLLSGRVVRAAEAERMGLANRVTPVGSVEAEALAYARTMAASCSPWAMRAAKFQLYRDLMDDLGPAYDRAEELLPQAFAQPDFAEGVASWKERRSPAFPPLEPELARIAINPEPARAPCEPS